MDRIIKKPTWNLKKIVTTAFIIGVAGLIGLSYYYSSGKSKLIVDKERITISEVKKDSFQEFIPVNGIVLPLTTIYLDAVEGGRVTQKFVEDGAVVKKDQPILSLVNTDLELSLINQETSVLNLLTQMRISGNAAQQNTIGKLNQYTDVDNEFTEAARIYQVDKSLYDQHSIGLQEFKKAENLYHYQQEKKRLTQQILNKDSISRRQEAEQGKQTLSRTQNALQVMRKKVGDLIVRAPIDGELTSLDAEIGQSKNKGERLGQLDARNGFKVRVDIDEHYISRIFTGLSGDCMLGDKPYKLKIKKIYTQVTNGRFQVDMEFSDPPPMGIRRGQSLQIRLSLSDQAQALLVAKGGFFQQTGGNWIYKLSPDGTEAYRVDIQLGRQNPDYYEVVSGLNPGDKVVTSSYENYGTMQVLILKKQ